MTSSWVPALAFASVSGWALSAAVLPRMCGVTENAVDAYLFEHPRMGFLLGLTLCLALMGIVARSSTGMASPQWPWRLVALVPFAWAMFEGTQSLLVRQWLLGSVPRSLLQHLHAAVWLSLSVITLWAVAPRSPHQDRLPGQT